LKYLGSDPNLYDFPSPGPEKRFNKLNALLVANDRLNMQDVEKFFVDAKIHFEKIDTLQQFQFSRFGTRTDTLKLVPHLGFWELHEENEALKRIHHSQLLNYLAII